MTKDTKNLVIKISADTASLNKELRKINKETGKLSQDLERATKRAAIGFTALSTSIGLTFKAFANFEEQMLGVAKTTDLTDEELKGFSKDIQDMSRELPFATNELAAIAQAAGQMGVTGSKNILKFTKTIAKLGTASDLSGDQAATALARILKVTGENIDSVDKLASTIVALGNKFPATESQIAFMTTQVAAATTEFGIASGEAAALSTALLSIGVRAELGGSVIARTLRSFGDAIREGGVALRTLEKFSGLTGEALEKTFAERPLELLQNFTAGLGELRGNAVTASTELAKLGLNGEEVLKVIPVLAKNTGILADTMAVYAKENANATALNDEFNRLMTAQNTKLKLITNTFKVFTQEIGLRFVPVVNKVLDGIKGLLDAFLGLDEGTKDIIGKIVVFGTALVGIVAGLGAVALVALKLKAVFIVLGAIFSGVFVTAVGLISVTVAAFAALGIGVLLLVDRLVGLGKAFLILRAGLTKFFNVGIRSFNDISIAVLLLIKQFFELNKAFANLFPGEFFKEKSDQFKKLSDGIQKQIDATIAKNKELEKSFTDIFFDLREDQQKKTKEVKEVDTAKKEQEEKEAFEKATAEKIRLNEEREAKLLIQQEEFRSRRSEIDEEIKEISAEIKLEEDEIEQELLRDKLEELQKVRDEFSTKEELARRKAQERILQKEGIFNDKRKTLEEQLNEQKKKQRQENLDNFAKVGELLFAKSKKFAIAHFLLTKGTSLGEAIINTSAAVVNALKTGGPFPTNLAAAATVAAAGVAEISTITGSTLPSILGAQQGGLVGGGTGGPRGDRNPFMLENGELIAPRNNFDEVVEATARARGFVKQDIDSGGARDVNVVIDIADNAAELITAQQFENQTIGVDR